MYSIIDDMGILQLAIKKMENLIHIMVLSGITTVAATEAVVNTEDSPVVLG